MKYCTNCRKMVQPVKKEWSWVVFFLFLGIFYPVYRLFVSKNRCHICGGKTLISLRKARKLELLK